MPSVGIPAILPNTSVNMIVVNMGWIKCQTGPRMVCLYAATKSLLTKSTSRSRYFQTSLSLRSKREVLGSMIRSQLSGCGGRVSGFKVQGFLFWKCLFRFLLPSVLSRRRRIGMTDRCCHFDSPRRRGIFFSKHLFYIITKQRTMINDFHLSCNSLR